MAELDTVVIGPTGQLGQCLWRMRPGYTYVPRNELDLTSEEKIGQFFYKKTAKTIINLAAYTKVDKAEEEKDLAFQVNATASKLLAGHCERYLYVSTDYVFSGAANGPWKENDPTDPQNVYGHSKLQGEELAKSVNSKTWIVRTSWLYSEFGGNFLRTMLRLASERNELKVVNDQIGSPTYAGDLAAAIVHLVERSAEFGTYHFANSGAVSWYGFAEEIFALSGKNISVKPIPTADYPTPAKRPAYSVLDTSKISKVLGHKPRPWQEALKECLEHFK